MPDAQLNGHPTERLANNVNISFRGVRGDELVAALDKAGIAASAGGACGSSTWEPSHVLLAMGVPLSRAVGGLRLTVGPENTDEEIDYALSVLRGVVERLRAPLGAQDPRPPRPARPSLVPLRSGEDFAAKARPVVTRNVKSFPS